MRKLNYALAINEALHQMMEADESFFLIGQGLRAPGMWEERLRGFWRGLVRKE